MDIKNFERYFIYRLNKKAQITSCNAILQAEPSDVWRARVGAGQRAVRLQLGGGGRGGAGQGVQTVSPGLGRLIRNTIVFVFICQNWFSLSLLALWVKNCAEGESKYH